MNNVQLEFSLKEALKQIAALQQEVQILKSASALQVATDLRRLEETVKRAFKNAGLGTDWHRAAYDIKNETAASAAGDSK